MSDLRDIQYEAMQDELHKLAMGHELHQLLGNVGGAGGVGAAAGALIGGGVKGYTSYRRARDQGASVGDSLMYGGLNGVGGAMSGAVTGGLVGAGAAGAASIHSGAAAEKMRAALEHMPSTVTNFGKRQVHAVTGWTPELHNPNSIGSIGLGSAARQPALDAATEHLKTVRAGGVEPSLVDKVMGRTAVQGAEKNLESAQAGFDAAHKAQEMGLTSIPGYLKSLAKHPIDTVRAAAGDALKGQHPAMTAVQLGLPAFGIASAALTPANTPEEKAQRGRSIGRSVAGTAAGMLLSPMPMFTQNIIQRRAEGLGERIGAHASRPTLAGPEE
jgi:hypothetical protein